MSVRPSKTEPVSRFVSLLSRSSSRLWLVAWSAGVVLTAVAYLLPGTGPPGEYQADKIIHVIVFAALGMPLRAAAPRLQGFAWLAAVNVALAVVLEIAQSFLPGREFALLDIAANLVGLGTGIAAGVRMRKAADRWRCTSATTWGGVTSWRPTRAK